VKQPSPIESDSFDFKGIRNPVSGLAKIIVFDISPFVRRRKPVSNLINGYIW
jgi:hypothetical protein